MFNLVKMTMLVYSCLFPYSLAGLEEDAHPPPVWEGLRNPIKPLPRRSCSNQGKVDLEGTASWLLKCTVGEGGHSFTSNWL